MIITNNKVKFGGLTPGAAFRFQNDEYMVVDSHGYVFGLPPHAGMAVNLSTGKLASFLLTQEVEFCPLEIYAE